MLWIKEINLLWSVVWLKWCFKLGNVRTSQLWMQKCIKMLSPDELWKRRGSELFIAGNTWKDKVLTDPVYFRKGVSRSEIEQTSSTFLPRLIRERNDRGATCILVSLPACIGLGFPTSFLLRKCSQLTWKLRNEYFHVVTVDAVTMLQSVSKQQ